MSGAHEWKEVVSAKKKVASLTSEDYETQVQLFLETFKTKPCTNTEFHEFSLCPDHRVMTNDAPFGDQHRNPFEQPYSVDEAIGPIEMCFHPLIYRTQMCRDDKCKREVFCARRSVNPRFVTPRWSTRYTRNCCNPEGLMVPNYH